jgi:replication factor C subunit 3/5
LFCTTAVLVLNEVDKLSREAQHSLRRTMEKYSSSCRLILCCNSSSKVTEAVRSRCLNIRVNAPTQEEVSLYILVTSAVENMSTFDGST